MRIPNRASATMRIRRACRVILAGFVALCPATGVAQTQEASKIRPRSDETRQRRVEDAKQILALAADTASKLEGFAAARGLAVVADARWDVDRDGGRKLFEKAATALESAATKAETGATIEAARFVFALQARREPHQAATAAQRLVESVNQGPRARAAIAAALAGAFVETDAGRARVLAFESFEAGGLTPEFAELASQFDGEAGKALLDEVFGRIHDGQPATLDGLVTLAMQTRLFEFSNEIRLGPDGSPVLARMWLVEVARTVKAAAFEVTQARASGRPPAIAQADASMAALLGPALRGAFERWAPEERDQAGAALAEMAAALDAPARQGVENVRQAGTTQQEAGIPGLLDRAERDQDVREADQLRLIAAAQTVRDRAIANRARDSRLILLKVSDTALRRAGEDDHHLVLAAEAVETNDAGEAIKLIGKLSARDMQVEALGACALAFAATAPGMTRTFADEASRGSESADVTRRTVAGLAFASLACGNIGDRVRAAELLELSLRTFDRLPDDLLSGTGCRCEASLTTFANFSGISISPAHAPVLDDLKLKDALEHAAQFDEQRVRGAVMGIGSPRQRLEVLVAFARALVRQAS